MTLQTEKFIRKVRPVEAVKVTEDNIDEVAKWCGGLHIPAPGLAGETNKLPYIHVAVNNPRDASDTKAFPDMWIIRVDFRRYLIMNNKRFRGSYESFVKPKAPVPTPKSMPTKRTTDDSAPTPAGPDASQAAAPVQVGAVEVVPGTPPDEGSSLTTGTRTVHRSAESGEFVTEAEADANPATTVEETITDNYTPEEKAELAALEAEEAATVTGPKLGEHDGRTTIDEMIEKDKEDTMNEGEMSSAVEPGADDLVADELAEDVKTTDPEELDDAEEISDVVPGDMVDPMQPEQDEDGTVQLGVPVEDVGLPEDEHSPGGADDEPAPVAPELCGKCGSLVVDGVCSNDIDHDIFGTAEQATEEPDSLPGD